MKRLPLWLIFFLLWLPVFGETDSLGNLFVYPEAIHEIEVEKNLVYGKALSHSEWNSEQSQEINLVLDLYMPTNKQALRPVIFLFHGGGFENGSKEREAIVQSARYFASRGFVAVAPNYRLARHKGTLPGNMYEALLGWPDFLEKDRDAFFAMYPASRDAKAAVRWLYANAKHLRADTNRITALGNSAGALISAMLGTTEAQSFRDEIPLAQDPTQLNNHLGQPSKIHTVINRWGGPLALDMQRIFFGRYPYDKNDAPMQIVHGTLDTRVPFTEAMRLMFNYELNDIQYELHPLHWIGHNAGGEQVNGKSFDKLAFEFIVKVQALRSK